MSNSLQPFSGSAVADQPLAERADCEQVSLRPLPYPYRAMLAISSDLDETPDRHAYWEIARFLNTTRTTTMGPGVGLEVGNSIYFDMPSDQFSYWNTDDAGRAMLRTLIRSGHIDCLHSYGDLAATRAHAEHALEELARHDCKLHVWVDHAAAPTNFGGDIMRGHGDKPGHDAYHADLTTAHGIRYVWRGRVTSVIGQDVPPKLSGLGTWRHPLASARTIAKQRTKLTLGRFGNVKYEMHSPNKVLRLSRLRDGSAVWEFLRSNPHWRGVSSCDTGREIGKVLTGNMLECLSERGGVCILYTHLGKKPNSRAPFDALAVEAFRRLACYEHDKRIIVRTTSRILQYLTVRDSLTWSMLASEHQLKLYVRARVLEGLPNASPLEDMLGGITFYVPKDVHCTIEVDGRRISHIQHNAPDDTGRPSVSFPFPSLEFPNL